MLRSEYGEELSIREFREVMKEILKAGGIERIENEVSDCWDV